MQSETDDMGRDMMLDGNAVAGRLLDVFGADMTASLLECASCRQGHLMGALLAFTNAPGMVLRCPSCEAVVLKLVETPRGTYVDSRGAAFVRISR